MNFSYPSPDFPGFCAVSMDAPEGWSADAVPLVFMLLVDPEPGTGFRVNLTVKIDRVDGSTSLQQVIDGIDTQPDPVNEIEVLASESAQIDGYDAVLRVQSLRTAESTPPLFQAQALVLVPTVNPKYADLVMVHATSPADAAEANGPVFRAMIDSIRITPWAPAPTDAR